MSQKEIKAGTQGTIQRSNDPRIDPYFHVLPIGTRVEVVRTDESPTYFVRVRALEPFDPVLENGETPSRGGVIGDQQWIAGSQLKIK